MAIFETGRGRRPILRWTAAVGLACAEVLASARAQCPIQLSDVTKETGIPFKHTDGSGGRYYIMETVSAGLALFDYDVDGDVDIYFLNGSPLPGKQAKVTPRNALYRNDGHWKFTDVTGTAGIGDTGYGLGVAVADYDNDGDPDIYLNNYGPNVMYRNNGDGTFDDVTKEAGVGNGRKVGAGACFLDMDGDGDLDLYAANYLAFSNETHARVQASTKGMYAIPRYYPPVPDTLYRNNGNGTFTDASTDSGVNSQAGWGMGMVCCDYDNDDDTDIFIANDVWANFLFQNDGQGRFEEVGLLAGVAYDAGGQAQAGMGVDCGDFDNDGWLDFYLTDYQNESSTLYRNRGDAMFEDVTFVTGAGAGTYNRVTWGNGFVDFDNDGQRDIFVACGHLQDNIERFDDTSTYHQRNILLLNTGQGTYVDVSDRCGDGLKVNLSSRGAGFDDLDNDGDIDVVILNSRREPTILRNDSANQNHWLQVQLQGIRTNRHGIGAHVKVVAGDLELLDEVHSGRAYQSHYGVRLHFGLGSQAKIDRVEVRWIGGGTDTYTGVPVDQRVVLEEGGTWRRGDRDGTTHPH